MDEVNYRGLKMLIHGREDCVGCPWHGESLFNHLSEWGFSIRFDRDAMIERHCPAHGIGHPDPDWLHYVSVTRPDDTEWEGVHGCCGCC